MNDALSVATPAQLATWEGKARQANDAIQTARVMLETGETVENGRSVDDYLFEAQEATEATRYAVMLAARAQGVAAEGEERFGATGTGSDLADLSRLAALASPAARRLLELLRAEVLPLAETVDRERGRALRPEGVVLGSGETYGTDIAEALSVIALRLAGEVEGPTRHAGRE
jgi:hypothetical protein